MENEEHEKRLQAQAERDKRRRIKKIPQIDSSTTIIAVADQVDTVDLVAPLTATSQSIITSLIDAAPKCLTKRLKVVDSSSSDAFSEQTPVFAPSSSVALGCKLSSMLPISGDCPDLLEMDSAACGVQSAAHMTQALLWNIEQTAKSRAEAQYRDKLSKDLSGADDRVIEEKKKADVVASVIKKLRKKLKRATREKNELKTTLVKKEKELAEAVEAKLDAETVWYGKGKMARLAMVRDAGLPYMDCLASWEREMGDPFASVEKAPSEEESGAPNDVGDRDGSDETGED